LPAIVVAARALTACQVPLDCLDFRGAIPVRRSKDALPRTWQKTGRPPAKNPWTAFTFLAMRIVKRVWIFIHFHAALPHIKIKVP